MIDQWLALPGWLIVGILLLFYAAAGLSICWISFGWPLRRITQGMKGVVAPFFTVVSVLFALQTGFLGNEVANRARDAWQVVNGEAGAIRQVYALSLASPAYTQPIRVGLRTYLDSVLNEEWRLMNEEQPSERTERALTALLRAAGDPAIAQQAGPVVQRSLLDGVVQIGAIHSRRLAIASDGSSGLKWIIVLLLGVLTQLAVAVVHLERLRPQMAAVTLFSTAAVVVLGLIAVQDWPFGGAVQVSAAPLVDTLKAISGAAP
jgi:hypothetical protein